MKHIEKMKMQILLGKTGVEVPLTPIPPVRVQNIVPCMSGILLRIRPMIPPIWASAMGAATIAATNTHITHTSDFFNAIFFFFGVIS